MRNRLSPPERAVRAIAAASCLAMLTAGCAASDSTATDSTAASAGSNASSASSAIYDASQVHQISMEIDDDAYADMLAAYMASEDKEWIEATVVIDGQTFKRVGIRLKGNSSLRQIDEDAKPEDLPWLISLNKYVDGQDLDGNTEFVVRSNSTETAMNEAVALGLLEEAGLASERAIASSFSVNGSDAQLRLVIENLDDVWDAENFDSDGILYKAESTGDYSYRGDDASAYDDVFDQETNTDDPDLEPLIGFLDFINNSTDAEFEAQLSTQLDVEEFATYLAFEDLVGNFDDIDGPGNNSYLRWDDDAGKMTVVAWDHNLAFGSMGGMGGGGGMGGMPGGDGTGDRGDGMEPPEGMQAPEGMTGGTAGQDRPEGTGGGGPGGRSNVLVDRFMAVDSFSAMVDEAKAKLTKSMYDDGSAEALIKQWSTLLTEQAGDLVKADVVTEEADAIRDNIASTIDE